jgi:hypothetical protein
MKKKGGVSASGRAAKAAGERSSRKGAYEAVTSIGHRISNVNTMGRQLCALLECA